MPASLFGIPLEFAGIGVVTLIIGLVEAVRRAKIIPTRFLPLIAALIGLLIGLGITLQAHSPDYVTGILTGLGLGLAASGVYDGATGVAGAFRTPS